jgi:hypothetical protein
MNTCPDCAAKPGELHVAGCDVERCPVCGRQALSCGCDWSKEDEKRRIKWTGLWPGEAECEEYGLWCVGPPWTPVPAGTPNAIHDLNRLYMSYKWDRQKQKFVPK